MSTPVTDHTFTLVFAMSDDTLEPHLDALLEAGCDDAAFAGPASDGTFIADFDREAASFGEAVASATRTLRATLPAFHLLRIEPVDLVSQSSIAQRTGRSDESIRLYIAGRRGPGQFPPAIAAINDKTHVWSWAEVVLWWERSFGERLDGHDDALFIAAVNARLRSVAALRELRAARVGEQVVADIADAELIHG